MTGTFNLSPARPSARPTKFSATHTLPHSCLRFRVLLTWPSALSHKFCSCICASCNYNRGALHFWAAVPYAMCNTRTHIFVILKYERRTQTILIELSLSSALSTLPPFSPLCALSEIHTVRRRYQCPETPQDVGAHKNCKQAICIWEHLYVCAFVNLLLTQPSN